MTSATLTPEIQARAAALQAQIRRANHEYYVLDTPALTDAAYDALVAELRALEAAHPALVEGSPWPRSGHRSSGRRSRRSPT